MDWNNLFNAIKKSDLEYFEGKTKGEKWSLFVSSFSGITLQMKGCPCAPVNTFASHFLRWQQQHHRLVHSRRTRVWPCVRPVPLLLRPVHHEAVLPRPRGKHSQLQTGPGWQAGHPAALWSVTIRAHTQSKLRMMFLCVKGRVQPKLLYYSPLCGWRFWSHFLIHITYLEFHRQKEFHPNEIYYYILLYI